MADEKTQASGCFSQVSSRPAASSALSRFGSPCSSTTSRLWWLTWAGQVDMLTGSSLQSHLNKALASRLARLIVDVSQVSFLGSTGLSVLINIQAAATHQGITFQLRGVGPAVARVLQVTKLDSLFEILPAEEGPLG